MPCITDATVDSATAAISHEDDLCRESAQNIALLQVALSRSAKASSGADAVQSQIDAFQALSLVSEGVMVVIAAGVVFSLFYLFCVGLPRKIRTHAKQPAKLSRSELALLGSILLMQYACTDMYASSIPSMAQEFAVAPVVMSTTVQINRLVKCSFGLCSGCISDRVGRRPVMLVCCCLLVLSSLSCACASSFLWFMVARTIQGMGESIETVIMAVVRDSYDDPTERAKVLGLLLGVLMISPIAAPCLGGLLAHRFGWRPLFLFMAAFFCGVFFMVWMSVEESIRDSEERPIWDDVAFVLADQHRIAIICSFSLLLAVLTSFVSFYSTILETSFGLPAMLTASLYGVLAAAYMAGTLVNTYLSGYFNACPFDGALYLTAFVMLSFTVNLICALCFHDSLVSWLWASWISSFGSPGPMIALEVLFMEQLGEQAGSGYGIFSATSGTIAAMVSLVSTAALARGTNYLLLSLAALDGLAVMAFWSVFAAGGPTWAANNSQLESSTKTVLQSVGQKAFEDPNPVSLTCVTETK